MKKNEDKSINTQTLNGRVTTALNKIKRSKSWLAEKTGLSRQALHYVLSKGNGGKHVSKMADALKVDYKWLESGEGKPSFSNEIPNIISLLKLKDVNSWIKGSRKEKQETITIDYNDSHDVFAINLGSSSMQDEFAQDSILIFKVSLEPTKGDYVLAQLNRENKDPSIIFRKYTIDGNNTFLEAIDSTYRTITDNDNFSIIGVLIEQRRIFHS